MTVEDRRNELTPKLVDSLYTEAMLLADEARSYFDLAAEDERQALDAITRVGFACESLKVTTRLMHIIAWLLTQRAVAAGEISRAESSVPERRLGEAPKTDHLLALKFPDAARSLIQQSEELFDRCRRLDRNRGEHDFEASPARSLMSRLERSF